MTTSKTKADVIPRLMQAVLLTGYGDYEMLSLRDDVNVPTPASDQVLIKVGGAGINNTDINTRLGWYSKSVKDETSKSTDVAVETEDGHDDGNGWGGSSFEFPRIQGSDCCGTIVAVGTDIDPSRLGERVLVRTMMSEGDPADFTCTCTGSEHDGAFAEYMATRSRHALKIECDWTDAELASIPCAYSTAEGLLHRAGVAAETVLITGASGGVGSAAIQLVKRRGGKVIAVTSAAKFDDVLALGADQVLDRSDDLVAILGENSVDVAIDLVAGPKWPSLLEVLKRGGRYATSGAIAGPMVELDMRTLYLKDLSFYGATFQPDEVFENLVGYIERGEIRPALSKTYPLSDIVAAQQDFVKKKHTGKLVLIPGH
ncbi:MAG: NADPH:quinone reductase-like Zn-dependent oxidoreductase [Arenicella sp.]|jgi:NADPH:quinone reductase-like Zn-dependent oxidoreductase